MRTAEVEAQVNNALRQVHEHPFVHAAHAGELSRDQAVRWVFCAGRESRSFPWILRELLRWTTESRVREILQDNLDDELGRGDPDHAHFRHYLDLLDNLGVPRSDFDRYVEGSGIKHALSLAFNVATNGKTGRALGYMLVNEALTPVTYEAARDALTPHHPGLATDFFDLHIAVDEHHVAALYEAVEVLPETEAGELTFGVGLGQRGMEVLLDEAYGVLDTHREPINITAPQWDPTKMAV